MPALPEPPVTALIEVRRLKRFSASGQPFRILVDENKAALVTGGSTVRIPVPPGRHTVRVSAYMMRSGSATIDAAPGERVVLQCWAPGQSEWFWTPLHVEPVPE